MSFFAELAQGLGNGLSIGQSIKSGQEERERRRRIGELAPGIISGDKGALADYSKIVGPNNALATGSGVMAMQQQQRQQQLQGIATGLAYFGDVKTPEQFEARKAAFAKTPFADMLPADQLTWQNFPQLQNMAVAAVQSVKSPDEIAMIKSTAQQAAMERDKAEIGLRDAANARIGAARGPAPAVPGSGDPSAPRGIRNNNPGNIMSGGFTNSRGASGDDGRFARFETPQQGIKAVGDLLDVYERKHGLDTVQGIINRWAPPSENDTRSYINQVAQAVGAAPDEKLDLSDPGVKSALVGAIIKHENGQNPYPPEMISGAISGRDLGAERARDALSESNPALGRYAPQGQISDEAGAALGASALGGMGEAEERTAAVKNAEAYADAKAQQAGEESGPRSPVWMSAYTDSLSPKTNGLVVKTNADGSTEIIQGGSGLTKTNETRVQDDIIELEDNVRLLTGAAERYKREYLTVRGGLASKAGNTLGRLNSDIANEAFDAIGPDLLGVDSEQAKTLDAERGRFMARANQYFDQYKKMISGAAVAASEMKQLRESIANPDMSPQKFERVLSDTISFMERSIAYRKRLLSQGISLPQGASADRLWNQITEEYNAEKASYRPQQAASAPERAPQADLDRDITLDPIMNGQPSQFDATDSEVSKVQQLIDSGMDPDEAIDQVLGGSRL